MTADAALPLPGHRPRRSDGLRTREALLRAARTRFARDGYDGTTVRDIAADAGANVALINRYFGSKEGLFQACLDGGPVPVGPVGVDEDALAHLAEVMAVRAADGSGSLQEALLLRLRPATDPRAEAVRVATLRSFGEQIAAVPSGAQPADVALRAQLVLALATGVAVLRGTPGLTPLSTADVDQLRGPLRDAVEALLRPAGRAGVSEPQAQSDME